MCSVFVMVEYTTLHTLVYTTKLSCLMVVVENICVHSLTKIVYRFDLRCISIFAFMQQKALHICFSSSIFKGSKRGAILSCSVYLSSIRISLLLLLVNLPVKNKPTRKKNQYTILVSVSVYNAHCWLKECRVNF